MLAGQNIFRAKADLKVGDLVYIMINHVEPMFYYNQRNKFSNSFHGVIVNIPDYNNSSKYLCDDTLIGVLVNGEINWYMPNELFRLEAM